MRILLPALTALALALPLGSAVAAPGHAAGEGHDEVTFGEPGDPSQPARLVPVTMRETDDGKMIFAPDSVTVQEGEQVRFKLTNRGQLEHEFVLGTPESLEEHAEMMAQMPEMEHADPNSARLDVGETGEVVWRFTEAGEVQFACLIPGHLESGMVGKVVVD